MRRLALNARIGACHPAVCGTASIRCGEKREIAFVPLRATSDDLTRSHFETQDTIELGQSSAVLATIVPAFISRLAAELSRARPIAFTEQLPLNLPRQGPRSRIWGSTAWASLGVDDRQARLIKDM